MADNGFSPEQLQAQIRELQQRLDACGQGTKARVSIPNDANVTDILLLTTRTACFSWRNDGSGIVYSDNAAEALGYPPMSSTRDFIRECIADTDRERIRQAFKNCILRAQNYSDELQLVDNQNQPRWFQLHVRVMAVAEDGQAAHIVGSISDIDRIKSEQLEQASIARTELWMRNTLRQLLEDDSWSNIENTLQSVGQFFGADRATLRLREQGSDQFAGVCLWSNEETPTDYGLDHDSLSIYPELQKRLKAHQSFLFNTTDEQLDPNLMAKLRKFGVHSGVAIPIHYQDQLDGILTLSFLKTADGWTPRLLEAAQIIGDALARSVSRNRMTRSLEESDQRYTHALEASRDGLWDWNLKTNSIHFSDSYLRMLGYQPGEVEEHYNTFQDQFMYPEDVNYVRNVATQGLNNKFDVVQCEFRMLHKSGRVLWIYSRSKYVDFDEQGNPTRCVGINADITQFKQAQAELRQAKVEAITANQTKNEFLTRMSHEIRTPMNAIIGMGHLLKDTQLDHKQKNYLTNINDAAASLLHIIDEILDFSKLESGKYLLENAHFDLDNVYDQLSAANSQRADEKNIELIFDIAHDVPRFIKGDSRRLNQVLHNLIDNAVKFTDSGGEIIVRTRKKSQRKVKSGKHQQVELEFSVVDSGIGIDSEKLLHLFDPFTQADGSSSRRFGGTGLGLTICKYLVDQMGGELHVSSEPGNGSCFTFTANFDRSQLGEQPVRHEPQRYHHLRTLIVDDHNSALAVLENTARSLKLQVETASSAEEAITLLSESNRHSEGGYELVFMDYKMPRINGLEGCKLIREHADIQHKPKTILISNYNRSDIATEQPLTNIDGFISKPVTPSRMFDAIALAFGEELFEQPSEMSLESQDLLLTGSRVLLAEDNLVNQKVAIGILKKKGVEVTVANNGQEAIDLINAHDNGYFGAVLMDMEMPEVDGYEATRRIRTDTQCTSIPIIAMTAHALQGDRQRCLEAGMNDYITKPVNPELLYKTLANYLTDPITD